MEASQKRNLTKHGPTFTAAGKHLVFTQDIMVAQHIVKGPIFAETPLAVRFFNQGTFKLAFLKSNRRLETGNRCLSSALALRCWAVILCTYEISSLSTSNMPRKVSRRRSRFHSLSTSDDILFHIVSFTSKIDIYSSPGQCWEIHRAFDRPEEFIFDRLEKARQAGKTDIGYIPFGGGKGIVRRSPHPISKLFDLI
jgi:hypothetical protein